MREIGYLQALWLTRVCCFLGAAVLQGAASVMLPHLIGHYLGFRAAVCGVYLGGAALLLATSLARKPPDSGAAFPAAGRGAALWLGLGFVSRNGGRWGTWTLDLLLGALPPRIRAQGIALLLMYGQSGRLCHDDTSLADDTWSG